MTVNDLIKRLSKLDGNTTILLAKVDEDLRTHHRYVTPSISEANLVSTRNGITDEYGVKGDTVKAVVIG